jgi:hypothetical protein
LQTAPERGTTGINDPDGPRLSPPRSLTPLLFLVRYAPHTNS